MRRDPSIAAIIPALNEGPRIARTIAALRRTDPDLECLVVDGGSGDDTREQAAAAGARVITAPRGRGAQQARGAAATTADILWFVHADTLVPPAAATHLRLALARPGVVAGHFRVRFDGPRRAARLLSWVYPRLRPLGIVYGDAAIFTTRAAYEAVGGMQPYPIFEDLDLLGRLRRRGRVAAVSVEVLTSSRRFHHGSLGWTFARWTAMQLGYWAGVSPHRLGRWYATQSALDARRAARSR